MVFWHDQYHPSLESYYRSSNPFWEIEAVPTAFLPVEALSSTSSSTCCRFPNPFCCLSRSIDVRNPSKKNLKSCLFCQLIARGFSFPAHCTSGTSEDPPFDRAGALQIIFFGLFFDKVFLSIKRMHTDQLTREVSCQQCLNLNFVRPWNLVAIFLKARKLRNLWSEKSTENMTALFHSRIPYHRENILQQWVSKELIFSSWRLSILIQFSTADPDSVTCSGGTTPRSDPYVGASFAGTICIFALSHCHSCPNHQFGHRRCKRHTHIHTPKTMMVVGCRLSKHGRAGHHQLDADTTTTNHTF